MPVLRLQVERLEVERLEVKRLQRPGNVEALTENWYITAQERPAAADYVAHEDSEIFENDSLSQTYAAACSSSSVFAERSSSLSLLNSVSSVSYLFL